MEQLMKIEEKVEEQLKIEKNLSGVGEFDFGENLNLDDDQEQISDDQFLR